MMDFSEVPELVDLGYPGGVRHQTLLSSVLHENRLKVLLHLSDVVRRGAGLGQAVEHIP